MSRRLKPLNQPQTEETRRHREESHRLLTSLHDAARGLRDPESVTRDLLSLAMRGGRMGAWSRDLATDAVWWSSELEELFGLERGGFTGTQDDFFALIHEDERADVRRLVDNAIEERQEFLVEFRFHHTSGEWRWMEARGRAVDGADGQPILLYGIGMDVTQRKRAVQDYAYATAIVASSDDAIISKTLDGVITSWNAAAEHIFGYTAAEAIGRSITMIIPPDRLGEEKIILQRLRNGQRIEHFETIRRAKDGTLLDISLTTSPVMNAAGKIIGASKIARDISDRKRTEADRDRLLASEQAARVRAEEASRLKDEFLATVSHELRTPLSAIMGWARMLHENTLDDSKRIQAAEVIERNGRTLTQLIEDLLDVSRIITGKLRLNIRAVMPAVAVEAAVDAVRPMAESKGVLLHSIVDPNAGPVSADVERLQQIAWNLLSNALKFTPKHGHVQVRVQRVDSHVELLVSDTGQGISPQFLPHVFDRFRQADSSTTRVTGGLGLGLAIVRHLVELHGGQVHASSPGEGHGATFTVILPTRAVQPEAHGEPRSDDADGARPPLGRALQLNGLRILVVDDEPDSRTLLREVLEACGAEVRDAGSARLALEHVQEWRPSVIVSDIGMPLQDGYQFIQAVRAWEKQVGLRIPAVALTAYARSEDRMKSLMAGYQVHLAKPVDPQEVALVVASLAPPPLTPDPTPQPSS